MFSETVLTRVLQPIPSLMYSAAWIALNPLAIAMFFVSSANTSSPSYSLPDNRILLYVPLNPLEILTASTFSYPSDLILSNIALISPPLGNEVVGISVSNFAYISSAEISTPSKYSPSL